MIDLGRPALHGQGLTIFPDHANPALFYYLPDCPRLRRREDGTPELSLLKYQLDPTLHQALGAGMLGLTVDLGADDALLQGLRPRLRAQFGLDQPPVLQAVVADHGSCELIVIDKASTPSDASPSPAASDAGPALVERILGSGGPSLYGENAASFMAVLDAEGVSLVEQALRAGGLPVGVVYTLETLALRPAIRAQITAHEQDVYHYYENRLHGGRLLAATDIGATIQELVHSEALSVTVDDFLPPDQKDHAYQQAIDEMQSYVIERFFKPTLGSAPPPAGDAGDGPLAAIGTAIKDLAGFFSVTYSLKEVDRNEFKTFTYQLQAAEATCLTLAPQGTLSILLSPNNGNLPIDANKIITEVAAGTSEQMDFDVGAALNLDAEDIDHLEVFLRYADQKADLVLDAATPRRSASFWYRPGQGLAVQYRFEVSFKAGSQGPQDMIKSPDAATDDRVIRLDPRPLYQRLRIRAVAQGVPFDQFPSVIIDLKAVDAVGGWSCDQTLQLDAAHLEAAWAVRAQSDASLTFHRRLRYVDARGVETLLDWDHIDPGVLIVGNPYPDVLDLPIIGSARFDTEVRRIIVELRLKSQPQNVATKLLTGQQQFATWSVPLQNRADRAYEYRVTIHTVRNEVHEGQWLPGGDPPLVVGEGIARLRQVQMMFVGRSLKDLQLLALKVRFVFDDPDAGLPAEAEFLVQELSKPLSWSYPISDPARQAFTYQVSLIHADSRIEQLDPVTTQDLLIIYPLT